MSAFDALRRPSTPAEPDRRFADDLRARITAALAPTIDLPDRAEPVSPDERTTMTTPDTPSDDATTAESRPAGIVAYLAVADATSAIDWYIDVFGAREIVRYVGDDDRIGHAELAIGGAVFYLSDEYPEIGVTAPPTIGGTAAAFVVDVGDVDAVYAAATAAGAAGQRPPADQPYGDRSAALLDPFGHRWMIQTTIATPTHDEIDAAMEGYEVRTGSNGVVAPAEIGYVAIAVDDTDRAVEFYEALFGWQPEPGHMGVGYAHIANTELPIGFTPAGNTSSPSLYVRVDDVDATTERAVELGGEVLERSEAASGTIVECRDVQGRVFHIWQPAPGY